MEQSGLRVDSHEGSNHFALGDSVSPEQAPTLAIASPATSNRGGDTSHIADHNGPIEHGDETSRNERRESLPLVARDEESETLPNLFP